MKVTPELKRLASAFFIKKNVLVEKSKERELKEYISYTMRLSKIAAPSTLLAAINEQAVKCLLSGETVYSDYIINDEGSRSCDCVPMVRFKLFDVDDDVIEEVEEDAVSEVEDEDVAVVVKDENDQLSIVEFEEIKPKKRSRKKAEAKDAGDSEAS